MLNICTPGHLDAADSYGIIALELARHLQRLGACVNLFALGNRQHSSQDAETAAIVAQPIRAALGGVFLGWPTGYAKHPAITRQGPRVAITMFESTLIPSGWAQTLSDMDAVIVPSTFCAKVFRACGVTAPIHVAALGVSCTYKPAQRPPDRPLTFLAFLDRGKRKGGTTALQAFLAAFGDDMNYRLILKGREVPPARRLNLTNPNIEVIQQDMTERELYELFCSADVLIDCNRGEGFGMIGRQFSATGGISLSTNWGGTADWIEHWGLPIHYKLVPADWSGNATLAGQDLGLWAEPCLDGLVAMLRRIADNRLFCQSRAQSSAERVGRMYTWKGFAERVLWVWEGATNGDSSGNRAT